ncbi:MAG TPA: TolC family protein [Pyrinomonadaceae bacterium]|nr:TolC family protein [Pyrinomonadaceae bacterium]
MFIESARPYHFFRKERNAKHFALCGGDDKSNRVAINISPLCGDDSGHVVQRTNRRTFEAKQFIVTICVVLTFMTIAVAPLRAQTQAAKNIESTSELKPANEPARLHTQLKQVTEAYKSNLEQVQMLYQADAKAAEERLAKIKELLAQGLVTRRELQTAEEAAAQQRLKLAEAEVQLKGAEVQIAEALIEAESEESPPKVQTLSPQRPINTLVHTTAYIRYGGARVWSLSQADIIKQFFMHSFGRALPIGAFGQTALHNRWGYDHRNAMDVGISPDSAEGQMLMNYLRANGIPFTAFHYAVPGKATGPHIHVGLPSHRIGSAWAATNAGSVPRQ